MAGNISSTREKLILAGMEELMNVGIENFSTRNVAKKCGLSCAAPYKHFKDTQEFISEIFGYFDNMLNQKQKAIVEKFKNCSLKDQLLQLSLSYIHFLVEYPIFRTVVMQSFQNCKEEYRVLRGKLSLTTEKILNRYRDEVKLPENIVKQKIFIVRSLIYSAALFFETGEIADTKDGWQMVTDAIAKEIDV